MTAPVTAPPRWPADAALLREVFRAARAKHWSRVFGDGPGEHLPEGVTVVAEWDKDGSLIELTRWPSGGLRLSVGAVDMDVVSLRCVVDTLVAWDVLPMTLSSAYAEGRGALADEIHACAEYGQASNVFFTMAEVLPVLGDALTYWSSIACGPDAEAVVGSRLDGLLDREPFARRRQTEDVVSAVMDALASHLAALIIKEREVPRG